MNLDLLKTIWSKVYNPKIDTTTIEQFFHLNFKQCINGDVMMISDCSHFFHGKLLELRSMVEKFIADH